MLANGTGGVAPADGAAPGPIADHAHHLAPSRDADRAQHLRHRAAARRVRRSDQRDIGADLARRGCRRRTSSSTRRARPSRRRAACGGGCWAPSSGAGAERESSAHDDVERVDRVPVGQHLDRRGAKRLWLFSCSMGHLTCHAARRPSDLPPESCRRTWPAGGAARQGTRASRSAGARASAPRARTRSARAAASARSASAPASRCRLVGCPPR